MCKTGGWEIIKKIALAHIYWCTLVGGIKLDMTLIFVELGLKRATPLVIVLKQMLLIITLHVAVMYLHV